MYKRATTLILLLLFTTTPAQAVEVYRCLTEGGMVYQEKPCTGIVIHVETAPTGVSGLRPSEVDAYLDAVESDVYRITPQQARQLDTVMSHIRILRKIVD